LGPRRCDVLPPVDPSFLRLGVHLGIRACVFSHVCSLFVWGQPVVLYTKEGVGQCFTPVKPRAFVSPRVAWLSYIVYSRRRGQRGARVPSFELHQLGMKTVSEFFGIPKTDFEIFQSDSPVTVFFENRIGFRNFLPESAWCFTDRFLRLPILVGNYRICVSEFSGIVS
jgi:hypothetical protein